MQAVGAAGITRGTLHAQTLQAQRAPSLQRELHIRPGSGTARGVAAGRGVTLGCPQPLARPIPPSRTHPALAAAQGSCTQLFQTARQKNPSPSKGVSVNHRYIRQRNQTD